MAWHFEVEEPRVTLRRPLAPRISLGDEPEGGDVYITRGGELIDQIAWSHYGAGPGFSEIVFDRNPGLSRLPLELPENVRIVLPPRPVTPLATARLWS